MHPALRRIGHFFTRHIDGVLLTAVLLLMVTGLLTLFSASNGNLVRTSGQLLNMMVALAVMWVFANVPPHVLQRMALPLFGLGVALLVGVALFGEIVNGARRWLDIGITRIQPSELMRIALPMALAWYFNRNEATLRLRNFLVAALMLAIPAALILRQPDLGTALLISASGAYLIFLAGLPWRIIIALGVAVACSMPFLWSAMHDYQRQRVMTLIDPTADPLGSGYHTIQSTIAVGSGGILGKGWMNGTQTHLDFIPERTTDFIFAVYAEEFGLIGNLVLLAMLLFVIARAMMITANAPTLFTRLLAGSITMTFCTYAFVNMGMVSGILPVVGVPLPLISYGGTSLVSICISFGILMSINTHKKLVQT
ncbi:MAG: rod shape-determining protein RodA [Burkholderiales bacterium]|nr:rod shape-determining protein RodA [Burkholderiales bacterium]